MAAKATGCMKNPPTNVKCTRPDRRRTSWLQNCESTLVWKTTASMERDYSDTTTNCEVFEVRPSREAFKYNKEPQELALKGYLACFAEQGK